MTNTNNKPLLESILGRSDSFLQSDIESVKSDIQASLSGARILVIGAAGSIGCAFVAELSKYSLRGLHLVDISENNLVEVVRDMRAGGTNLPTDFKTFAIDFGGIEMAALLRHEKYHYVLNFSALKHVRSERDPFTLMRLLQVNVLSNEQLLDSLSGSDCLRRVFSVSSDKSVRPANLMGASKSMMERVFLARADEIPFTSARFANVAFSDGSLLHGFGLRLAKQQPISAPRDIRRYFITHQEAGQLCLLGCFTGNNREIFFPKFDPDRDMLSFAEIARIFLSEHGYEVFECASEAEALQFMKKRSSKSKEWACYFSNSDTTGEKDYEEFWDTREEVDFNRFKNVGVITKPIFHGKENLSHRLQELKELRASGTWTNELLLGIIQAAVPELQHVKAARNLDQKM